MFHVLAQDLRNAVLQAAFEGKLSETTPTDSKLNIESSFSGEEPYDLPNHWKWCCLGDVVWNRKQKKPDKTFSYIDIGSIDNEHQKLNNKETIIEADKAPSRARKTVEIGDIIYSTVRPYLHNMAIIDRSFSHEPIASTGFAAMVCNEGISNRYLFNYLKSPYFDRYANDTDNSKGVAYPAINDKKLYAAPIPVCSFEEQARIVARVDELMAKIDEYEKIEKELIELQKAFPGNMKDAILQSAFEGKLTSQEKKDSSVSHFVDKIRQKQEELLKNKAIKVGKYSKDYSDDLPEIPDNWRYIKMGDISSLVTKQTGFDYSKTIKPSLLNKRVDGTVPYIQTRDFNFKNFNFDTKFWAPIEIVDKYPNIALKGKHLLLSIVGSIGNVGLYDFNKTCLLGGAITKIDLLDDNLYDYVYYYLQSPLGQKEISKNKHQTAQATVTVEDMRSIAIPLPPLEEQQRIIDKLEQLLPLCESLEAMI